MTCAELRELLAELALDVAPAGDRAVALIHIDSCGECAALLADATPAADALLLLAPEVPLPSGLRGRVIAAASPPPPATRPPPPATRPPPPATRPRVPLRARGVRSRPVAAVGIAVTLLGTVLAGLHVLSDGRSTEPPRAATLRDGAGRGIGDAVLTRGRLPSLFLSFAVDGAGGEFRVEATDGSRGSVQLGRARESGGICTFSHVLPVDPAAIRTVALVGPDDRTLYTATFSNR